jgi:hypothetical protein
VPDCFEDCYICGPNDRSSREDAQKHGSPNPPWLAHYYILTYSNENGVVLDPMAGFCSTLLAAISAKRRVIGFEINPEIHACAKANVEGAIWGDASEYDRLVEATNNFSMPQEWVEDRRAKKKAEEDNKRFRERIRQLEEAAKNGEPKVKSAHQT